MNLCKTMKSRMIIVMLILTIVTTTCNVFSFVTYADEGDTDVVITSNMAGDLGANINTELGLAGKTLADVKTITVTGNLSQTDLDWFANNRTSLIGLINIDLSGADATGLEISQNFMNENTSIKQFKFPIGITSIGDLAFNGCTGLSNRLIIPATVTYVGNSAYQGCTALTGFSIPSKIITIGDYVFKDCINAQTVSIMHSITKGIEPFTNIGSNTDGIIFTAIYYDATYVEMNSFTHEDLKSVMSGSTGITYKEGWATSIGTFGGIETLYIFPIVTGTIKINNDASHANSVNVSLNLSAVGIEDIPVSKMRFSNDGTNWTEEEDYSTSKEYTLPTGDGNKTVYVQFKTAITFPETFGAWSETYSDSIILDTVNPTIDTVTISSNNANSSFAQVGDTVTLVFIASEKIVDPVVTIAGQTVTAIETTNNTWSTQYIMQESDTQGPVAFSISGYKDIAGNNGLATTTTTDVSQINFSNTTKDIETIEASVPQLGENFNLTIGILAGLVLLTIIVFMIRKRNNEHVNLKK